MEKRIENKVYEMTNPVFEESMKILLDLDNKIPYENDLKNKKTNKKRIAIVYDKDGWAFCNIANEIKKYLGKEYDITIFPVSVFMFLFI